MKRHRHQEFLRFLRTIDRRTPPKLDLHLVLDNYATHKHAKVTAWLDKHPRFHLHFTPTSASWLNQVERFFGLITHDRSARRLHLGARTRSGHPRLPRPSQCPPQALRLDKIGRANPCQSQPRASHPRNRCARESSDKLSTLALRRLGAFL